MHEHSSSQNKNDKIHKLYENHKGLHNWSVDHLWPSNPIVWIAVCVCMNTYNIKNVSNH